MVPVSWSLAARQARTSAEQLAVGLRRTHLLAVSGLPLRAWADKGRHRHDVPTVIGCLSGGMRIGTGPDSGIDIAAGDVVVVPPGALHLHHHQRLPHAAFEVGHLPGYVDVSMLSPEQSVTMAMPLGDLDRLLHRIARTGDHAERHALLHTLLRRIVTAELTPVLRPPPVQRMLERIWWQSHLPTLQVSAILAASGLGATRARGLFLASIGLAPKAYLTSFRLGIAHGLIDGGWALEVAARESGFADAACMRRCARTIAHPLALLDRRRRVWRSGGDSARYMA